jgi:hypothetical protein
LTPSRPPAARISAEGAVTSMASSHTTSSSRPTRMVPNHSWPPVGRYRRRCRGWRRPHRPRRER